MPTEMPMPWRGRRAMPPTPPASSLSSQQSGLIVLLLILLSLALLAPPAAAQERSDIPLARFHLPADRNGVLDVEWAAVPGHLDWDVALWVDWADDALVAYRDNHGDRERAGNIIHRRVSTSILASVALWNRLQVAVELPIVLSQTGDASIPGYTLDDPAGQSLGDLRLQPKIQILDAGRSGVDVAFVPSLTLPTGMGNGYGNESGFVFTHELIASRSRGPWRVSSTIGYLARQNTRFGSAMITDELFARLGAGLRLDETARLPVEVAVSLAGGTAAESTADMGEQNHVELYGGASYRSFGPVTGVFAAGVGLRQGVGTPDWRAVVGVRLGPGYRKAAGPARLPALARTRPTPRS